MKTENLISFRECAFTWTSERTLIFNSLFFVLGSMCKSESVLALFDEISTGTEISRLVPVEAVLEFQDATLSTRLDLGIMNLR